MSSGKSNRQPFGCLLAVFGALIGLWLAQLAFRLEVQKIRARNPNAFICGNNAFPGMILGLMGGTLIGLVIGKTVEYLLSRSKDEVSTSARDLTERILRQEKTE